MRVKMLNLECGPNGTFHPGDEREVSHEHGMNLVDAGCAIALALPVREAAVIATQETAVMPAITKNKARK